MNFGIVYNSHKKIWETGANVCSLHLYKLLQHLDHQVVLITLTNSEDISGYNYKYINDIKNKVDILIDIDCCIRPKMRKQISNKCVVFLRGCVQFSELDKSVYVDNSLSRSFDEVSEVWVWDILNQPETLDCLHDLYKCPIRRVPFIWDSCHLPVIDLLDTQDKKNIRIMSENVDNTSSCILLLSGINELRSQLDFDANYIVHCTEEIWNNRFFKGNVLTNINYDKIPLIREDRVPYNSLNPSNNIVLKHSRFVGLDLELLDLIWLGIPFIHNSPILSNMIDVFRIGYYPNNSISSMINAVKNISKINWRDFHGRMCQSLSFWSIPENAEKWREVLGSFSSPSGSLSHKQPSVSPSVRENKKELVIGFSDMWPGFNYNSNFFTDAIRNNINDMYSVKGIDYWNSVNNNSKVNAVIFGPYSKKWKDIPNTIPKIFFSAENWGIVEDKSVELHITPYKGITGSQNFYLPTWMTFLDWFNDSTSLPSGSQLEDNPIRFPIHFATRVHSNTFENRNEFCAFVVSNPICKFRNNTFHFVNNYKKVNSGGALYNNIGGQLSLKYPGGGCGDISKYNFLKDHKFQICFENSQADGYITEKLLHSKIAGCVPIYWGDKSIDNDEYINTKGFINVSNYSVGEEDKVLNTIVELENNKELCKQIASTSFLTKNGYEKGLSLISNLADRILSICGIQSLKVIDKNEINRKEIEKEKEMEKEKEKGLDGIDKVVVINLNRRQDRWNEWCKDNSFLSQFAQRFSAVDGKLVHLTPDIYKIFKYNSFNWKRAMIGCTLSHMAVWQQLLNDNPDKNSKYLILEDDMRFSCDDWLDKWNNMKDHIPLDADVLYIGGVLPTNKSALPLVLDNVNKWWAKIKPNKLFTQGGLELPIFHFCAYSYILTSSGAKKLLDWLQYSKEKCFTCDDHLIGDPRLGLNKYVSTPFITNCFQENDEAYITSDFNTVNREAEFDSDIWNSIDNVPDSELEKFKDIDNGHIKCMNDVIQYALDNFTATATVKAIDTIYYLNQYVDEKKSCKLEIYEEKWLRELLGKNIHFKEFNDCYNFISNSWIIVMRPHSIYINNICNQLLQLGKQFRIIHLSDEFCNDCTDFYKLDNCTRVIRNYITSDVNDNDKIKTIPLGYHHIALNINKTKYRNRTFNERELVWSFCGTKWFNRDLILENFKDITPNKLHLTDRWESTDMIGKNEYLDILGKSKLSIILRGNNWETFRLYECLEHGVIPIIIRDTEDKDLHFWNWINKNLCLIELKSVDNAKQAIQYFLKNPDIAEKYRSGLITKWGEWKNEIKEWLRK